MSYYLVHCDTFGCVYFRAIIGIADDKSGVLNLLHHYYKIIKQNDDSYTFEGDHNDIKIYKISEDDYLYLEEFYKEYTYEIEEGLKKWWYGTSTLEPDVRFWGLTLNSDNKRPAKKLTNEYDTEFYKKYKIILKKGKLVF
jgi:hypothetical protein